MYCLTLTHQFTASHALPGSREDIHFHDWIIKITVCRAQLNESGMVINYLDLLPLLQSVLPPLNACLNQLYPFLPTAEHLAEYFYTQLYPHVKGLHSVSVGEFEALMCTYTPKP